MLLLFDIQNMKIEKKRTNLRKEFGIHKNEIKITITKIERDLSVFRSFQEKEEEEEETESIGRKLGVSSSPSKKKPVQKLMSTSGEPLA